LDSVIEELTEKLGGEGIEAAERQVIEETITAVKNKQYKLVVTGAGGAAEKIGLKLAAKGITFKFLGKIAGRAGIVVGIVTEENWGRWLLIGTGSLADSVTSRNTSVQERPVFASEQGCMYPKRVQDDLPFLGEYRPV